jgi:hypothetical protein
VHQIEVARKKAKFGDAKWCENNSIKYVLAGNECLYKTNPGFWKGIFGCSLGRITPLIVKID